MAPTPVYIGIDVACRKRKALPICVVSAGRPLLPMTVPAHLCAQIPRGVGNREIEAPLPFREAARGVVSALNNILDEMNWKVERIAIDAPASSPAQGKRLSETQFGASLFSTPSVLEWTNIKQTCRGHLDGGGALARIPYANKIWMLFGFELFACFRENCSAEVLEVFPFAIVRTMLPTCSHKKTPEGYRDQLAEVADRTGWKAMELEAILRLTVPGSPDDRLDAFMAAWVASLPTEARRAFGDARNPDDAIWVPVS